MTDQSPEGREPQAPAETQPPPAPRPASKRITRSRDDRVIGGVAGGIAHTYGWDVSVVRVLIAVAAVFTAGAIALAYAIAWLVIPEEATGLTGADLMRAQNAHRLRGSWALPVGVVLVAAGMLAIAHRFAWAPFSGLFWPITLIAGGLAVLFVRHRDPIDPDHPAPDTDPNRVGSGEPVAAAATQVTVEQPTVPAQPMHAPWPVGLPPRVEPPPKPPRERSMLGRLTWSALLVLAGGAWLLDTTGAVAVDAGFVLTIALVIVGLALVVGTWFGRSRGLIALAIVLTAVCAVDAALDVPLTGGIGERIYRVADANNVQRRYNLAIGHLVIDLRSITASDHTLHVDARDALGQLEIVVPADAQVDIRTRVGAGDLRLFDEPDNSGWRVDQRVRVRGSGPRFVIDARVGFGQLVVRQGASS